jgi:hypothetical protein
MQSSLDAQQIRSAMLDHPTRGCTLSRGMTAYFKVQAEA